MATGRIGVTPVLRTRWSKQPTAGTTSLSGLDDNSVSLVYDVGYEAVYRNGVLLSRGNDYTATSGTSITLIDATLTGDIVEVFANDLVPLTDAISKGQFTAKGALLSATAASTPGVITVGANDTVLTADSTTSTGLKWAAPAPSGTTWTLLNTGGTALTGATTITVSGISARNKLMIIIDGASSVNNGFQCQLRLNSDSGFNYRAYGGRILNNQVDGSDCRMSTVEEDGASEFILGSNSQASRAFNGAVFIDGANTSGVKSFQAQGAGDFSTSNSGSTGIFQGGWWNNTATVTSVSVLSNSGNFDAGTIWVYTSAS